MVFVFLSHNERSFHQDSLDEVSLTNRSISLTSQSLVLRLAEDDYGVENRIVEQKIGHNGLNQKILLLLT